MSDVRNATHAGFPAFARLLATWSGRSTAFFIALGLVLAWLVTGPLFGYSDTWQLVINTSTTIITFLMVFLIQHTQNVDSEAMQIKLDELIRSSEGAHNALLDLEQLEEAELDAIRNKYQRLAERARADLRQGNGDTGSPATENDDEALL